MGIRWCEFENPESEWQPPRWQRKVALADDGTVFIAGRIINCSDVKLLLCAAYDGEDVVEVGDHAYYPADWLAREFPNVRETVEKVERLTREHFGGCPERSRRGCPERKACPRESGGRDE